MTEFIYYIHDDDFVDYFESRICWRLKKSTPYSDDSLEVPAWSRKVLDADAATPVEPAWIQNTKAQLQNCWELDKKRGSGYEKRESGGK